MINTQDFGSDDDNGMTDDDNGMTDEDEIHRGGDDLVLNNEMMSTGSDTLWSI